MDWIEVNFFGSFIYCCGRALCLDCAVSIWATPRPGRMRLCYDRPSEMIYIYLGIANCEHICVFFFWCGWRMSDARDRDGILYCFF